MAATKTDAFVLKTRDYRDTSLLADFYTREYGKIRGIIKGIRDTRARFGSMLEPFSLNEILFYRRRRGGDLHQVTQIELLDLFGAVREDLERLSFASYFVELVNELVEPEEPIPAIFDLLLDAMRFLASGASARRAARIFEIKLFEVLGLMPEVHACVACGVEAPNPAFFNVASGGIRCQHCNTARLADAAKSVSMPVSKGSLHFLGHVQRAAVKELYPVKVSQEVGQEIERILRRFVDYHLSNKLNSVSFLEKMGFA